MTKDELLAKISLVDAIVIRSATKASPSGASHLWGQGPATPLHLICGVKCWPATGSEHKLGVLGQRLTMRLAAAAYAQPWLAPTG